MNRFLLRGWWILTFLNTSSSSFSLAQQPIVNAYWIKVVTIEGNHVNGILSDVDNSFLYLSQERNNWRTDDGRIPLNSIRKVAIRRKEQTPALITGAILGGLLSAYLANQSLRINQARSPVSHGLTLTFAAAGGAASGLLVGSAIGKITRRIVRPLNQTDPEMFLFRQLAPFSVRYQQDFINRLPKPLH